MNEKVIKKLEKLYKKSLECDSFPVAAIIYDEKNQKIISTAYNKRKKTKITIDHAEVSAITKANKKIGDWRLSELVMYVTLEPCEMCKKIINESRLSKVYYLTKREIKKQQFKGTKYLLYENNNEKIVKKFNQKYKNEITSFFINKR